MEIVHNLSGAEPCRTERAIVENGLELLRVGMSIESAEELRGMEHAGKVTRAVLDAMKTAVRPGISTRELDELGAVVMRKLGGRSAPKLVYAFAGENCIRVNEEIVHGVPSERKLVSGDLVKLDVTVEVRGFMAMPARPLASVPSIKRGSGLSTVRFARFSRAFQR